MQVVTGSPFSRSSSLHRKFAAWGVQRPANRSVSQVAGRGPTNRHRHEIQNKTGGLFDEDARRRGEVAGEARAAAKCIAHWRCSPGTPACVDPILCYLSLRSAPLPSPCPSPVPVRFFKNGFGQPHHWELGFGWIGWMDGPTNPCSGTLGLWLCGGCWMRCHCRLEGGGRDPDGDPLATVH